MPQPVETVATPDAPRPAGHYVQATVYAGVAYVSGQLPVAADGRHHPDMSFEVQVRQALANLLAIVAAAGSRPDRILKVTAYIVGAENWGRFNDLFAEAMGDHRPARTVVPVADLHYGYLIELDALAATDPDQP